MSTLGKVTAGKRGRAVVSFDVQGDLQARRELGALAGQLPFIQERAIGTLRRRLPVEARRDIQKQYNIRATRVRKDLSVRTLPDGLKLVGHFRGVGLRNFAGRPTRKGVTYAIFRGRRELRANAFIVTLRNDNQLAVLREGKMRERTYRHRKRNGSGYYTGKRTDRQLVPQYGPTMAQMLRKGRRPERLGDYARDVLDAEVQRLLQSARTRAAGGAR